MCLAVYLGCDVELPQSPATIGALGYEPASWRPAPISKHKYIYYFGCVGSKGLECSCLLAEGVFWSENGPTWEADELFHEAPTDPFTSLRELCEDAITWSKNSMITLYCDDQGGGQHELSDEDLQSLDRRSISASGIVSGAMLFCDDDDWANRVISVLPKREMEA